MGHGQFNSSIPDTVQPRINLDKLTSLYDLGIFMLKEKNSRKKGLILPVVHNDIFFNNILFLEKTRCCFALKMNFSQSF